MIWLNVFMSEQPKSYPWEGSDFPKNGQFYPKSLKPGNTPTPKDHLADESAVTGNPGDLGGGYNDLNAGRLQTKTKNPYWPTDEERRIGREYTRETLESLNRAAEANNAEPENQDPS